MGLTWWNCHLLCCTPLCYFLVLKCFQIQLDLLSFRAAYEDRRASLVAQIVKNLPAMQETWVWSLGWEDSLEKETANLSRNSVLEKSMDRGAWQATVHGVAKSWTWLSNYHSLINFIGQSDFLSPLSSLLVELTDANVYEEFTQA